MLTNEFDIQFGFVYQFTFCLFICAKSSQSIQKWSTEITTTKKLFSFLLSLSFSFSSTLHLMVGHPCSRIVHRINIGFKEERRNLLEVIGPELQSIYDDRQIEVTDFLLCLRGGIALAAMVAG